MRFLALIGFGFIVTFFILMLIDYGKRNDARNGFWCLGVGMFLALYVALLK